MKRTQMNENSPRGSSAGASLHRAMAPLAGKVAVIEPLLQAVLGCMRALAVAEFFDL